jgi:hypothetical protein
MRRPEFAFTEFRGVAPLVVAGEIDVLPAKRGKMLSELFFTISLKRKRPPERWPLDLLCGLCHIMWNVVVFTVEILKKSKKHPSMAQGCSATSLLRNRACQG